MSLPERKLSTEQAPKPEISGDFIMQLSAVVKEASPRGKIYFLGWNQSDMPALTNNIQMLGDTAKESARLTDPTLFSFRRREWADLPLKTVQYIASSDSIDRVDVGSRYTQDLLSYGFVDDQGQSQILYFKELDVLNAIADNVVVWESVNLQAGDKSDGVSPTQMMYSLVLPAITDLKNPVTDNQTDSVLWIQFEPDANGKSNEKAFQRFLISTMDSLINLDKRQTGKGRRKKGYERALAREIIGEEEVVAHEAYGILNIARNLHLLEISDEKLEQIRIESSGVGFWGQLMILAREFGTMVGALRVIGNLDPSRQHLQTFDTTQMIELFKTARDRISNLFY